MLPNITEREKASGYVYYELATLLDARRVHDKAAKKQTSGSPETNPLWNAVQRCALESFLTHYRNLFEFLTNKDFKDNLLAEHYASGWSGEDDWRKDAPEDEQKRINKLLAHISFKRDELGTGSWCPDAMEARVCRVFSEFIRQLTDHDTKLFSRAVEALDARARSSTPVPTIGQGNPSTATVISFGWWALDFDCFS